jgi:excisionase family DNA binding protein
MATSEQLTLIWESMLERDGENGVRLVARKPLSRMSTKHAARVLGVSVWTINKLHRAGKIHGYKPGAVATRRDGRASNAALVLDAESVLRYHAECKARG